MTDEQRIDTRTAGVTAVTISTGSGPTPFADLERADPHAGLPTVALEICIGAVSAGPLGALPHEHVIVGLDVDDLDAIEKARVMLSTYVVTGDL